MADGRVIAFICVVGVIIAIILIAFLKAYIFTPIGNTQITQTTQHYLLANNCDSNRFIQEYGRHETWGQFSYNSKDYFILYFNNNWPAIVESANDGKCYFVDNEQQSEDLFRTAYFATAIYSVDSNFYSPFILCNRPSVGAQKVCDITSAITNALDSITVNLIVHVPDSAFDAVKSKLEGEGFTVINVLKNGVKLVKYVKGSIAFTVSIELIKETSCALADAQEVKIFHTANDINQTFTDAKNAIFNSDTLPIIVATNETLKDLYLIRAQNTNIVKGATDWLSNTMVSPYCNSFNPINEINSFENKTQNVDTNGVTMATLYYSTYLSLKTAAYSQLQIENSEKDRYQPDTFKWFFLTGKSIGYTTLSSGANNIANQQLFKSATNASKDFLPNYKEYWWEITPLDYVPSLAAVIVILLIGLIAFLLPMTLKPNES
ncbi:MAG: hypothetical protein NTZ73_01565 [Candidatus Diapherotrites archaeon]|nr:hypothetical protein [Candidatus Diapherotrites archaeon]